MKLNKIIFLRIPLLSIQIIQKYMCISMFIAVLLIIIVKVWKPISDGRIKRCAQPAHGMLAAILLGKLEYCLLPGHG